MDERRRLVRVSVILAVYFILAAILPAADDEIYYWCWSKDLQWSYYDHPPMTAVLIRLSTSLFGDSFFGLRVPACIASAFVLYVIDRLTRSSLLVWGIAFSPLFTIGAVLMTPDSPLLMFWAAYVWWLVELHRRLSRLPDEPDSSTLQKTNLRWWFVGGTILGCGVLSKYTMGLAVPSAFISLLVARRPWREWLGGYVAHGIVAFIVASPILIYNVGQNFEPLRFQWQHSVQKAPIAWRSLLDFIGVQVLLFGTLPFFLLPWVIFNFRRLCQDALLRVCACMYAIPILFFIYKSTQTRLEGNWALVCFVSFWPVAATWFESIRGSANWRWATASGFLPPAIAVLVLTVHLIHPIPFVPPKLDRLYRQFSIDSATREVAKRIRAQGDAIPVYSDTYQKTAWLRFQSLPAQQIDGLTRPSYFTRPPRRLTDVDQAYVVTTTPLAKEFAEGFSPPEQIASVPVNVRGEVHDILNVWLYSKIKSTDQTADERPQSK